MVAIPYADIAETADRRWTLRLLARLEEADLSDEEVDDLVEALQAVSDPRSFAILEAVACDAARPARTRRAGGAALRGMLHVALDLPADRLRRWWQEGDAVLSELSLRFMDGVRCPDIVLKVAADATHPLQAEALGRMEWWFDRPEHEAVKIAGLDHPDSRVRAAAAYVLLWDEPAAAELPLIEATHDSVPEVAAEAANTLEYYPSVCVVRRLHEMLGHDDEKVHEEAEDSFQSIRNEVLVRLRGRDRGVADHVRFWLRPVWDILAFGDEERLPDADADPPTRREERREAVPVPDLLALLADPDASPRLLERRLRENDWSLYQEDQRRLIRAVLLGHGDQLVREQAAWAFAAWRDVAGLLALIEDADFCVRKSAIYNLGRLPPKPGIAGVAWDHLHRHDTLGTHATETLDTFVRHADPADAVRRLGWIAGDHGRREGLRVAAVHHLARLGAVEQVGQLAGQLLEPPEVTWALHIALLDAIVDLDLPTPDIGQLRDVDNLFVQEAVARCRR
jgi:HEAT repeat protein